MRKIEVDEVVSPGFRGRVIEGIVCTVTNLEDLEKFIREQRTGKILGLSHLYWEEWFQYVVFFDGFDAVLADTGFSILCHAAVLMRELGFVCVTISDLFDQIEDGSLVRITIKRQDWRYVLKDFFYNLRRGKHLFRYPRGAAWVCKLVVLDCP